MSLLILKAGTETFASLEKVTGLCYEFTISPYLFVFFSDSLKSCIINNVKQNAQQRDKIQKGHESFVDKEKIKGTLTF